jgi:hypothetical protein
MLTDPLLRSLSDPNSAKVKLQVSGSRREFPVDPKSCCLSFYGRYISGGLF